jgi:hypothetical protein
MRHCVLAFSFALALGACGGQAPAPAVPAAAPEEAVSRIGDITIRATALPTATLDAEVASRYGIARDERTVMLLVGVRKGADAQEIALPAKVTATATNLSGQRQAIVLRELRADGLLDYVGTVETSLPDTLRFELVVVPEGGAASTMQFSREFYPR